MIELDYDKEQIKDVLVGEIDYLEMCMSQKDGIEDTYWQGYRSAIHRVAQELDIKLPRGC